MLMTGRMPFGSLTEVRNKRPATKAIDLGMECLFDGIHVYFSANPRGAGFRGSPISSSRCRRNLEVVSALNRQFNSPPDVIGQRLGSLVGAWVLKQVVRRV